MADSVEAGKWIPWKWVEDDPKDKEQTGDLWEWSFGNLLFWLYELEDGNWRWDVYDAISDKSLEHKVFKTKGSSKQREADSIDKADRATIKFTLDQLAEKTGWNTPELL